MSNFKLEDYKEYLNTGKDATAFIQWAWDNKIKIPAGEYYVEGTLILKSRKEKQH